MSLACACDSRSSAPDRVAEDLTYFGNEVPAAFTKCGEPPCTEKVGKLTWTLNRFTLAGSQSYTFPGLSSTNSKTDAGPMVFLVGTDAKVHPSKAREASRVASGTVVDEYLSTDVPCVSHGTCRTAAILVEGKLVSSTFAVCYERSVTDLGGAHNVQSVSPEVIGEARAHQESRLPKLATERTVRKTDAGFGWDFAAQTLVRYDGKMLVGVNANATYSHPQFDAESYTGCVNTFVVMRSDATELLFSKYEAARTAEESLTVPR